ncbi:MAG: acetyltransferase [Pyrinomonadaceae bacterium]|nr:acetyltransferase [Pyrinomonadaceae bacterium]
MSLPANKDRIGDLIVWGASGHALVVADIIRLQGLYRIVAFYVDQASRTGEFCGRPLVTQIGELRAHIRQGTRSMILAIGNCTTRLRLAEFAQNEGFELATAIHPRATVASDVSIGEGTVVSAGAVINPGGVVGKNAIVNTCSSVDHESVIEDGAHIGPGARLGGRVRVGRAAWIGIGATIKDRVTVGANSIVGAGSVVLKDVPENTVAAGTPARVVRDVYPDEN